MANNNVHFFAISDVHFLANKDVHLTFGKDFTLLLIGVSILGVCIYGPYLSIQLYGFKKLTIKKTNIDAMLVLGVIVMVLGILNQIAGMFEALEALTEMGDVSPQFVMSGIIESFKVPVLCAFVMIISLIFWYFNKRKWESLNS